MTPDDVERAVTFLAGRAGEDVLLGAPRAGSEGDLAAATALLAAAHASVGLLNDDLDLLALLDAHPSSLYAKAVALVRTHRDAIGRVADALVRRRPLTGDDVQALARGPNIEGAPLARASTTWTRCCRRSSACAGAEIYRRALQATRTAVARVVLAQAERAAGAARPLPRGNVIRFPAGRSKDEPGGPERRTAARRPMALPSRRRARRRVRAGRTPIPCAG